MDVMYFLPILLIIAIPVIFGNVDFFNTLDVFIVKTCYECVVLGISLFCVNKASRSMHEVLSLQTASGLLS